MFISTENMLINTDNIEVIKEAVNNTGFITHIRTLSGNTFTISVPSNEFKELFQQQMEHNENINTHS
jgi:hypothetical protein